MKLTSYTTTIPFTDSEVSRVTCFLSLFLEFLTRIALSQLDDLETRLNEAISASQKLRAASKSIQNSRLPIHTLPPETLATIFCMVQPQVTSVRPSSRKNYRDWFVFSHVCRYWRETAISCPSLWCHIDIHDSPHKGLQFKLLNPRRDLASTFLERCRYLPLTVYFSPSDADLENDMLPHTARLKELHVSTCSQYFHGLPPQMWNLCRSHAPSLESLVISFTAHQGGMNDTALPELFLGHTPILKQLTLHHFSTWPNNQFKNLTRISLHHQPDNRRYPLEEFLDFLRLSPLVEELVLIDAGPNQDSIRPHDDHSVEPLSLSCLKSIEIGEWKSCMTIAWFLTHLVIPRNTKCMIWGQWNSDPSDVLSLVLRRLPASSCVKTVYISVTSSERHALFIDSSVLSWTAPYHPNQFPEEHFVNAQELHYTSSGHTKTYPVSTYRTMFCGLPALRMLALYSKCATFPLLYPLGVDATHAPLCLKLDTIRANVYSEADLAVLLLVAKQRVKNKVPIKRLQVALGADTEIVAALQSVIHDVEMKSLKPPVSSRDIRIIAGMWTPPC